jgi:hypothetical protein
MASAFSIHINQSQLRELERLMDSMGERAANRALSRAINRTLGVRTGGMRKTIADEIRQDVNLRKAYIYRQKGRRTVRTFDIKRATVQKPTGKIGTKGPNIPLYEYSHRRAKKNIIVTVQKSRGRKYLKHAFIPKLKSGHIGLFVRKYPGAHGKRGRKIKQLFSSRVPDVLINQNTMNRVLETGVDRFERELTHQIDAILKYNV